MYLAFASEILKSLNLETKNPDQRLINCISLSAESPQEIVSKFNAGCCQYQILMPLEDHGIRRFIVFRKNRYLGQMPKFTKSSKLCIFS